MKTLERLAKAYGRACLSRQRVSQQQERIEGLDEFHPKYVAWENRLHAAEQRVHRTKDALLRAALRCVEESP